MDKKDWKKVILLFLLVLFIGLVVDGIKNASVIQESLYRQEPGGKGTEEEFQIVIEGLDSSLDYIIDVEAMRPTREQAEEYFVKAMQEIDLDFEEFSKMDNPLRLPFQQDYVENIVVAEWQVHPWDVVQMDGVIVYDKIPEEGCIVTVSVTLSCGKYEKVYQFPVMLRALIKGELEQIEDALDEWIQNEMEKEGENQLLLPKELLEKRLVWYREKSHLTITLLLLELIALLVLVVAAKKQQQRELRKREKVLNQEYPQLVQELALLLGVGMNVCNAWNIIATCYLDNRQKRMTAESMVYEGLVRMNRRISEGENERSAYQQYANEMKNSNYRRLMRLLIVNLEKGSKGLSGLLEQEEKQAHEKRILRAKKEGEEASTKMLLPLMLMMIVVMTVIVAPAIIDFAI